MTEQKTLSLQGWLLLFALSIIWGGSFLSNRVVLEEVPVLTVVAFRVSAAAILLWIWVFSRRLPLPKGGKRWALIALSGVLNNVVPFTLIVWGQQHIPSGLAGILNSTTVIFTVLLAALVFADERLTLRKLTGVVLGFVGVSLAVGFSSLRHLDPFSLGQLAVVGATMSYAVAGVVGRFSMAGVRAEVGAAATLTASSLIMVPLALSLEGVPNVDLAPATWAGLLYLGVMASAVAYLLFYRILMMAGAGNLSLVTLLIAPIAIILGAIVYGETLAPNAYLGFAVIAFGLLVIDGRLFRRAR
ncbi:MAG TPA: DMT family transporter [Paracoccaceae bacterium]|nr:DMT family transporter [Paracoccaceae bacterium]